jgi:hypothetical protein
MKNGHNAIISFKNHGGTYWVSEDSTPGRIAEDTLQV